MYWSNRSNFFYVVMVVGFVIESLVDGYPSEVQRQNPGRGQSSSEAKALLFFTYIYRFYNKIKGVVNS